jgi:uncharacterized protein YbaR (Trm112 family)
VSPATTILPCPHCRGTMALVHQLDLEDMPEIYIFYCARCQIAENVKQERVAKKRSQIFENADA